MILDEVAGFLAAGSTRFTVGTDLLKGVLMDDIPADTCTAIYETAGTAPTHTLSTGSYTDRAYETAGIQILARSTSYQTARQNAQTAWALLDGYHGGMPTSTGIRYLGVDAVQSPFSIGRDRNQRHLISCNFLAKRATT
jgi:hypothetical protein